MSSPVQYTGETTARLAVDLVLPGLGHGPAGLALSDRASANSAKPAIARRYYSREVNDQGYERHRNDAEAQLVDYVANAVWVACGRDDATYAGVAAVATGHVLVASDQGPCRSCRGVIKQFRQEFPLVTVEIAYPKRDLSNVWGDPEGGSYGYEAAAEDRGMWRFTLLAHNANPRGW